MEDIEKYETYLKHIRNLFLEEKKQQKIKDETINKYIKVIENFCTFLITNKIFSSFAIDANMFKEFSKIELKGSDSNFTLKFIINTVKMFLKFLFHHEGVDNRIKEFSNIKVKTPEIYPNYYSQESIEKILKTLSLKHPSKVISKREHYFNLRNSIMVKLLISTGAKQEELRNIRLCAINLSEQERFVHITLSRERRGERIIPISKSYGLIEDIEEFKVLANSDYICARFDGELMVRREIEKAIEKFLIRNDLTFIGLQAFRHTYAKQLVEENYSAERMKQLLGYRNMAPILQYRNLFMKENSN